MTEQQTSGPPPNFTYFPHGERINPDAEIDLVGSMLNIDSALSRHEKKIADHDGQLKSLPTVIASVQNTLNAWIMVAGVIVAVVGVIAALEFYNGQKIDAAATKADLSQRADHLDQRVDKLDSRVEEVGRDIKALPDLLAGRIRKKPSR